MSRQVVVEVIGDSSKFSKATNQAITSAGTLTDKLQGIGKGIVLGAGISAFNSLANAIGGATQFVTGAIGKASDLNETVSKAGVVFGPASASVVAFGQTAARSFGMSENAAVAAAASIGNLLLSTGTAADKVAPMSVAIVKLAADLASFNNIPIDEALQKLQSGLVGQERPLRELGVAISAASVDSEALVLGFKKVNGVFTEGEKVQARYSLIFKQTGTAQGDFARTSSEEANSQRILSAEWENAQAALGQKLLPVVKEFTHFLADVAIPSIGGVFDAVEALSPAFVAFAIVLLTTATPAIVSFGVAAAGAAVAAAPFIAAGGLIAGAGFLLGQAFDMATQSGDYAKKSLTEATPIAISYADSVSEAASQVRNSSHTIATAIGTIGTSARSAATKVEDSMNSIVAAIRGARSALLSAASDAADAIYGPQIVAAELAQTKRAEADERAIVADKKSTAAQIADARLRLLELSKTQIEQETALAGYGNTSAAAVLTHQLKVLKAVKGATLEQTTLIGILETALAKLRHAYDLVAAAATRIGDAKAVLAYILAHPGGLKGFASGGHYQAGEPRIVGERGPELDVPDSGGTIMPKWGVGGGTVVNISISEGAFIDGPSIDRLVNMLTLRMRHASGI